MNVQTLNLMPAELRRRRFLIDRVKCWGTLLGIAVASLTGSGVGLESRASALRSGLDNGPVLAEALARARVRATEWNERRASFAEKQEALDQLARTRPWSEVVRELAAAADDGIWLWEVRLECGAKPRVRKEEGTQEHSGDVGVSPPARIEVSGYAVNNSGFASFLSRLSRVAGVVQVEPKRVRTGSLLNGSLLEFSITAVAEASDGSRSVRAGRDRSTTTRLAASVSGSGEALP